MKSVNEAALYKLPASIIILVAPSENCEDL